VARSTASTKTEIFKWTEERPWGRYRNLLDLDITKVKIVEVDPKKRLSYQSHTKRNESWTLIKGKALVTLDGKELRLNVGDQVLVPLGAKHRIENQGSEKMAFVEVQTGDYFGEDDIIRYQDDFGRAIIDEVETGNLEL